MFSELLENFLQHFGNNISRQSRVTNVPCQTVKNARPDRPSVDIPPEVLKDLQRPGFTWEIMRRFRLFDLEHLSVFSTMTDEEIDSTIHDFIARHGSSVV